MENFKIRVTTEQESKEAQSLAIAAGYEMDDLFCQDWSDDYCYLLLCSDMSAGFANEAMSKDDKLISLSQLKDTVVLNRNDVNDATHTDQDGWKWYIGFDSYVWQAGNAQQLKQWDRSSLDAVDLKPIKGEAMKESLNDKMATTEVARQEEKHNHYKKDVSNLNVIDPYRIADLYDLHPCAEHIMKKSLCAGGRGHKDLLRDIQDIIDTAERWKEIIEEDNREI